ncbi:MAG: N-acetylmuramoyl-L-alanine amidase [Hyphomicrobiaceae bacterium]
MPASPTAPPSPLPSAPAGTAAPIQARSVELSGDARRTRIAFEMSGRPEFTAYRLADPYRVIVDLSGVEFALPQGAGRQRLGLVSAFRYGLVAEGKSRIVIDTAGPVRIEWARLEAATSGPGASLTLDFIPATATEVAADEIAAATAGFDAAKPKAPERPDAAKPKRNRPIVVIDPGHGGIDSGAQGALGLEKDLVLAVALQIQRALAATRRYDIVMTRSTDVFLSLDQRVRLSSRHVADLFISIHADSLAARELAHQVRGATLYVLSDKASDDRSRRLAEKENAADLLAGLRIDTAPNDVQVRDILVDLMRRESATLSNDFRSLLLGQMRPRLALAKEPARAAPFKVLRQPGSPAVLLELGYISNPEDEKLMGTEVWQRSIAQAVTAAVAEYFRRQVVRKGGAEP